MKIREIINKIKDTSGTLDKKSILNENMSPLLQEIFEDVYDTSKKYYIKKFNIVGDGPLTIDENYPVFKETLNNLSSRTITGNKAIQEVETVIGLFEKEDQEILTNIIQRNLKIGVSLANFNDVNDSISKFEVALAENLEKAKNVNPIDGTYLASRKLDGCVDYYSNIEFEDGTTRCIGEVVENRIFGNIKSFDGESIVYKPITSHYKGDDNKQWYEIVLENGNILKITDNDRLMTKNGWKYVRDLTNFDEIMCE